MAEDGLILNFNTAETNSLFRPSFKGGHWKERLHVQRQARRQRLSRPRGRLDSRQEYRQDTSNTNSNKRLKLSNDDGPLLNSRSQGDNVRSAASNREVISSLFTYNPNPNKKPQAENDQNVSISPSNAPLSDSTDSFGSLGISKALSTHLLTKMNLTAPTAIQRSAISQLVSEESDAFIQAETGSGKTLAYLLPIVNRIMEISKIQGNRSEDEASCHIRRDSGLFALILAPTRELSKQISVVLENLLRCAHWIVAGTVIGGEKKKSEKSRLRKGLNILVATPGRLVDHLSNTEVLDVSNVRWLVLDEGDRLMELGFEDDIKAIISKLKESDSKEAHLKRLPRRRTTILCSATMKTNVEKLGEMSLENAIHIKADEYGEKSKPETSSQVIFSAPAQLKQSYIIVPPKQRLVTLAALLRKTFARRGSVMKAIVFVSCADSVDFHFSVFSKNNQIDSSTTQPELVPQAISKTTGPTFQLASAIVSPTNPGLTVYRLHGTLPQTIRTQTLKSFSTNTDPSILLCTDVASRGLDLPFIDLVVEYDPAFSAEDHLHRIGRTARAGRDGRATIFLMPGPEEAYVEVLKQSYREQAEARVSGTDADETLQRGFTVESPMLATSTSSSKSRRSSHISWKDAATGWQLNVERWVIENDKAGELARKAYVSHVRAYATHTISERVIFDVKSLHLGHLAKSFALRDKPGSMGRTQSKEKRSRVSRDGQKSRNHNDDDADNDEDHRHHVDKDEAKRKMRKAMKVHMGAANEFNIG